MKTPAGTGQAGLRGSPGAPRLARPGRCGRVVRPRPGSPRFIAVRPSGHRPHDPAHGRRGRITPQKIAQLATTGVLSGDVVLLHDADHYSAKDSWRRTAQALPLVLDELERRGLRGIAV